MASRALKRILAVDDDPDVLELATLALGTVAGYMVQTCSSGGEAVARSLSFRPDLILLDVMMPGVDGLSTLRALRACAATASTPVVFMTALVQRHDLTHYRDLGCLGVIPKPVDLAALPEMLDAMWKRKRSQPLDGHRKEFAALRREYMRGVTERIGVMRAEAAVLAEDGWNRPTLESLYHVVHRLAGPPRRRPRR
jgi:DNA-binding response OmpR family regulator